LKGFDLAFLSEGRCIMKRAFVLMLCGIFFYCLPGRAETLQKPTGKHFIGVTYLSFIDEGRKEIFDSSAESHREITVKAWYPTDRQSEPAPYLLKAEAEFAGQYLQFPPTYKDLITNASRDVPVSSKEKKYPVLIFSHGWGEHYSQNTILMEELASQGFIIFSIGHHYECKFSSYPDGRLIRVEMGNPRFQKIMREQMNPQAMGLFKKLENASSDEERVKVFSEMSATLPTLLTESPKYWAEDIAFLIDQLKIMNGKDNRFQRKLDLDRIGVFGMSMGGMATSVICSMDKRIKAGVNMDGGFVGAPLAGKCHIPFLFLNSKRYLGCGPLFVSQSTQDCYSLTVQGSDHYNFTDYSLYPIPMVRFLLGPIDGKRTVEIMNNMIPAFFDKYLKKKRNIDILEKARRFPEIEIATNVDVR